MSHQKKTNRLREAVVLVVSTHRASRGSQAVARVAGQPLRASSIVNVLYILFHCADTLGVGVFCCSNFLRQGRTYLRLASNLLHD